jgi:hypothetical protein
LGEVPINESDRFILDLTLSGFINEHGLYHIRFALTRDFLIDDYTTLPDLKVPAEMDSTTVRVHVTDQEIKVNHPSFKANDAIVIVLTGEVAKLHYVQVLRLNDGISVETFGQALKAQSPIQDISTPYVLGYVFTDVEKRMLGMVNVEPGTYVVAAVVPQDQLFGVYDSFTIEK